MAISEELKQAFFDRLDVVGSVRVAGREVGLNRHTAAGLARRAGRRSVAPSRRHPRRGEYETLRAKGYARAEAARVVGVNIRTARDWDYGVRKTRNTRTYTDGRRVDYGAGTITMVDVNTAAPTLAVVDKQLHPRFLSLSEREQIRDLRAEGRSLRAIGRVLGRPASTIMREIAANSSQESYRPYAAQRASAARRPRPKDRKLILDGPLRDFVQDKLNEQWSPEQICHALIKEHPDDQSMRVSVETIYQALYFPSPGRVEEGSAVGASFWPGPPQTTPRSSPSTIALH